VYSNRKAGGITFSKHRSDGGKKEHLGYVNLPEDLFNRPVVRSAFSRINLKR